MQKKSYNKYRQEYLDLFKDEDCSNVYQSRYRDDKSR